MKRFINIYILTIIVFVVAMATTISYYNEKIAESKKENKTHIAKLEDKYNSEILNLKTYRYLYTENKKDLDRTETEYKVLKKDFDSFKKSIAYAKSDIRYSRGAASDLTKFAPITTLELNEWIKQRAPKGSPFIGKGESFIRASQESGLDPKYLVAHAALESAWGTSSIARSKGNFFGIGAFNSSPYSSAYSFNDGNGIVSGAKWIARNYTEKGQNTLEKMIFGPKAYCQTDSGIPDSNWIYKINSIMTK